MVRLFLLSLLVLLTTSCADFFVGSMLLVGETVERITSEPEHYCTIKVLEKDGDNNSLIEYVHTDKNHKDTLKNTTPFWVSGNTTLDTEHLLSCLDFDEMTNNMNSQDIKLVKDNDITIWDHKGNKRAKVLFREGKEDGLWQEWYQDGQLAREDNYSEGVHTKRVLWYQNGRKNLEIKHINDGYDSTFWYGYSDDADNYKESERHDFYKNGKDGDITSITKEFDKKGAVISEIIYEGGKIVKWVTVDD